ncbi:tRNA (adenosine(37)-N6)-dimethylallyltransferase MiaA [Cysteiniphilum sp. 6C5]|uniref:tRNA (adenosine(37)-N6)-dimethylallyltransferase MiaA n=1 Tax=unclassified Cysteiniphilum TaxID=2610889 RepID=UPI003F8505ED
MSKKVYALAGPTASGKTALSIELAKRMNAEIISVDSALVYKRLDIGSAKPTLKEMEGVAHHLIDIIEPWFNYSVNDFINDAKQLIQEIHARNKEVLLVGGTMMYFKALQEGISKLPEADDKVRDTIKLQNLAYWYDFLMHKDPLTANKLNPNDQQRIERAVEVILLTDQPYSRVIAENAKEGGLGQSLKLCALVPRDRKLLHQLIEKRFMQMLDNGFLKEVEGLKNLALMHADLPSMRSVGYRQAWQYLDGEYDYNEFIAKGVAATRQLAKRQLTWIRNWQQPMFMIDANLMFEDKLSQALGFFDKV